MISTFEPSQLLEKKKKSNKKIVLLSILRLVFFLLLLTCLILTFAEHTGFLLAFLVILLAFVYLIKLFNNEQDLQRLIKALLQMNTEREWRASRNLRDLDGGEEFLDKNHPFANDLDLFGGHSLFQLLNHTVTPDARKLLASRLKMLQHDLDTSEFQKAIPELSKKEEFLNLFEGLGIAHSKEYKDLKPFHLWLAQEEKWNILYWLPLIFGPVGGLGLALAVLVELIPAAFLGLWLILGVFMMAFSHKYLKDLGGILPSFSETKLYRLWAEQIEKQSFQEDYLQRLSKEYCDQIKPVSKGLLSLEQLTFLIQNRFNLMYVVLNVFFWLDFMMLRNVFNWKKEFASSLGGLKNNLDLWQVLISYAIFTKEESLICVPEWKEDKILRGVQLKHPLIQPSKAIGNDFSMDHKTQTILLTGANMSGKTTFMRTLGINIVLANQGLGIFADSFECYPFQLFTSMRNSDNLGESVSSFYAELARIKKILHQSEKGAAVFFLMDEILKGTNTTDRIMGSEALIKQLAETKAKGIISTHDIELSALENDLFYLKNYSFHSDILEDTIQFDYKIKEGPCPSFNAKKLMQLMGIKINKPI